MQEVGLLAAVAAGGPGGVTDQHVDLTGLECRETLRCDERRDFEGGRVAENGGGDDLAEVDVEAAEVAVCIDDAEARKRVVAATLQRAGMLSPWRALRPGSG